MATLDPKSYNAAFAVLKKNAEILQEADEPDIDSLVPLVTESMAAFKVCKERLEAVRLALSESLGTAVGEA